VRLNFVTGACFLRRDWHTTLWVSLPQPRYIDTEAALLKWVAHLAHAPLIAVDTESDSFHRYREKVCLIQMSALGEDAIIDPLSLPSMEPLQPVFADPQRIKIFHDAGYDLICLFRDFGMQVRGLFDTMLASRLLGRKHFGLAALLREHCGFEADKRMQRSDWAQRPLTAQQLMYAQYDTHFLPAITLELRAELQACGRLAWAEEDFARLPQTCERLGVRQHSVDVHAFWRIAGARLLSPAQKGRLRAMVQVRDSIAQRLDRPPFKVFGDWLLLELARNPPTTVQELQPQPGLRQAGIDKFGPQILAALRSAEPVKGGPPPGSAKRRRTGRLLDPLARDRYEALRTVRRSRAEALGLEPEVALSNAMLEDVARLPPPSVTALCERPELRGWRGPLFAQAIFDSVAAAKDPTAVT
jgi:ribonuclease D